jgi:putative endonuclease
MGFTYIMSNSVRAVLYVGVTSNIRDRVLRHKIGKGSVFTSKYKCVDLVLMEEFPDMTQAIQREKQLKSWHRE